MKSKLNYKLLNILILVVIAYILVSTYSVWGSILSKVVSIATPFILAFVVAYALYPFVRILQKKGIKKGLSVSIVVLVFLLLTVGVLILTMPILYQQLIALSKQLLEFASDISTKFHIDLGNFEEGVTSVLNKTITSAGEYVSSGVISVISSSIKAVLLIFVSFILFVYFLWDMDKVRAFIKDLLKGTTKKNFGYVRELDKSLGHYFKGLAICMIIQFVEYSLLFLLIGHPNWLLLGVIGAVSAIVPYFGQLFTDIVALVTASVVSGPVFIATLVISIIFPAVDSYVISPKVYGKTNDMSPILIILGVVVGESIGGIIGIAASLPVLIMLTTTYKYFKEDIDNKVKEIHDKK